MRNNVDIFIKPKLLYENFDCRIRLQLYFILDFMHSKNIGYSPELPQNAFLHI